MQLRQNTIWCVQYSSMWYYDTVECEGGLRGRWSARSWREPSLLPFLCSWALLCMLSLFFITYLSTFFRSKHISMQFVGFQAFLLVVIFPVLLLKPKSFCALSSWEKWIYPSNGSVTREFKLHSFIFSVLFPRYWGEGAVGFHVPR